MKTLSNYKNTMGVGRPAMNVLRIAVNVADTETVTIGRDVYEFDSNATFTPGRIRVVTATVTPVVASAALAAAINASGTQGLVATVISANEVLIVSRVGGATGAVACTETMAGVGNGWGAATMYPGSDDGASQQMLQSRVVNATEVTLTTVHFLFPFTVVGAIVQITRSGVTLAFNGAVTISGKMVTVGVGTSTGDFQAGDMVNVLAAS